MPSAPSLMKPELKAAILVQSIWRAKLARRDVRKQRGVVNGENEGWQVINDPATGLDYYYKDGDVQWNKPIELMTEEEKAGFDIDYPTWIKIWDSNESTFYYFNQYDGVTVQWSEPEDYKEIDYSKLKSLMKLVKIGFLEL